MFDAYGRRVDYLRVSVTDRCNLRCTYCMPASGVTWLPHGRILSFEAIAAVARAAAALGFTKVRVTGGEPLVRRGVAELVSLLAAIPELTFIGMTTNGTLLAPLAADLKARGLSAVNVSLDTLDPARFAALTRGGDVAAVLAGVRAARAAGLPVKLNVVVPTAGPDAAAAASDLVQVREFAAAHGCAVQTIQRYRLDATKQDGHMTLRPPPCADCNRLSLLATGELKPCLHGDTIIPIDFADIAGSIRAAVALKPPCGARAREHLVSAIGG